MKRTMTTEVSSCQKKTRRPAGFLLPQRTQQAKKNRQRAGGFRDTRELQRF